MSDIRSAAEPGFSGRRPLRAVCLVLCFCLFAAFLSACGADEPSVPPEETSAVSQTERDPEPSPAEPIPSEEVSEMEPVSDENTLPEGAVVFTNLDYKNTGKMGDSDGPAVCYYSKTGYRKASMDVLISKMKIHTVREDKKFVNAYMFLGCDVFNGSYWCNCFDAGFCWSGRNAAWHLFYNIYEPADSLQKGWYESSVRLNSGHDYRLTLDTSEKDEQATIIIYDLTADKEADRAVFRVKNMKCDGSNTGYLMDFALDYPNDVRMDVNGKATGDWEQITLYNSDRGLYMRNVLVENTRILPANAEEEIPWTADLNSARSLWPDKSLSVVDYPCTTLTELPSEEGLKFRVDLDMNRLDTGS